ncbi:MAG: hypothetical protein ACXWB2_15535 [Acidimicrobiales bacterium]
MFVLGDADGRIGHGAIRPSVLLDRDAGERRPEGVGGFEIEPFVEIHAHAQSTLVHLEERSQPGAEELDHPRDGVREPDLTIGLGPLACVEGGAGDQELLLGEPADAVTALGEQLVDLGLLAALPRVGWSTAGGRPGLGDEVDVAHPERDRALGHAQLVAISCRVHDSARRSRARFCSATRPRYPIAPA